MAHFLIILNNDVVQCRCS